MQSTTDNRTLGVVLWMDQTAYTPPVDGRGQAQVAGEGATGRWQQLAILPTKEECEKKKMARVRQAASRDAKAKHGSYGERFRYLCSPVGDNPGT